MDYIKGKGYYVGCFDENDCDKALHLIGRK